MLMANSRITYVDAIRGLAMLFVVYGHVNYFSFRTIPFICKLTEAIQMPLFFFISGYVVYKDKANYSLLDVSKSLWSKLCYLIVPTVIMGILYSHFVLEKSIIDFVFEQMKYGYWFPVSLFTMFIIYELCKVVSKSNTNALIMLLIVSAVVLWCSKYVLIDNATFIILNNTVSLWQTLTHFPFFVLGILLSVFRKHYESSLSKEGWFNTVILVSFALAYFMESTGLPEIKFPLGGIIELIIGSGGVLLILNLFIRYKQYWGNSYIGQSLQKIGCHTLEIYLLHYFLLPDLTYATEYINTSSTIVGFAISITISLLIIVFSLLIGSIIRLSPILSALLLGVKKKK